MHGPLAAFIEAHRRAPRYAERVKRCETTRLASSNLNVTRNRPNLRDTQAIPVLGEQLKGQVWRSGRGLM